MRIQKIILGVLISLCIVSPVTAQKKSGSLLDEQPNEVEKYNLTEVLKLSRNSRITFKVKPFPRQISYRLYVESLLDFPFEKSLKTWVAKWNENNGKQFGILTFVENIKQADIILVRFRDSLETVEETSSSGPILTPHHRVGSSQTTNLYSPLLTYILLPAEDGVEIIWRHRKFVTRNTALRENSTELIKALRIRLQKRQ